MTRFNLCTSIFSIIRMLLSSTGIDNTRNYREISKTGTRLVRAITDSPSSVKENMNGTLVRVTSLQRFNLEGLNGNSTAIRMTYSITKM